MSSIYTGEIDFYQAMLPANLLPHQRRLILATQRNVAYVGGQGSGKSLGLCLAAIRHALTEPGGFSLIARLNMPALINSTMKTFLELTQTRWGEWKPSEKRMLWRNGHETVFWHLDTSDPRMSGHIKSMNLSGAFIDEATEISEEVYFLVDGRVRRKNTSARLVRLASNPGGHDWVWRHYFDPNRKRALLEANLGINASSFANFHLDADALEHWKATYPPDWMDRYVYGHFSDFSDLVYKDFQEHSHVWDSTQAHDVFGDSNLPPANWPVIVGIDIGSDTEHDPWAVALIAVAPDGRLYQFDEIYGNNLRIEPIATDLKAKLAGRTPDVAYDYAQRQVGALELPDEGIFGQPAIKEVEPGLKKVGQYMHLDPRLAHPFNPQVEGSPRFFVASHCISTIGDLTAYKWAKDRSGSPTGKPSHDHSHAPDAIRYAIHTFRPDPVKARIPKRWENEYEGIPHQQAELSRLYWLDAERKPHPSERPIVRTGAFTPGRTMQQWQQEDSRLQRIGRFRRPSVIQSRRGVPRV